MYLEVWYNISDRYERLLIFITLVITKHLLRVIHWCVHPCMLDTITVFFWTFFFHTWEYIWLYLLEMSLRLYISHWHDRHVHHVPHACAWASVCKMLSNCKRTGLKQRNYVKKLFMGLLPMGIHVQRLDLSFRNALASCNFCCS